MSKYVTKINGVDLFNANAVQCAELIFHVENVHPAIIKKVEQWQNQLAEGRRIISCMQEDGERKL